MRHIAPAMAVTLLCGCGSVDIDPDETAEGRNLNPVPRVQFDPANGIIPFPNNLVLDPQTREVNIPAGNCESPSAAAIRENQLNALNGFGAYQVASTLTFEGPSLPDPTSFVDHVRMFKIASAGVPGVPEEVPLTAAIPGTAIRFEDPNNCDLLTGITQVNQLAWVPLTPLEANATYVVAVLDGVSDTDGTPFLASGYGAWYGWKKTR